MPRLPHDAPLTTRSARDKLPAQTKPHWRGIEGGIAVGYRKSVRSGGVWLARVLIDGRYREGGLGRVDDALPADGTTVLDFRQAQAKALLWAASVRREAAGLEPAAAKASAKPYTVADAMGDYLAHLEHRGSRNVKATRIRVAAHIPATVGALPIARLTRDILKPWLADMAKAPPLSRGGKARPFNAADPDAVRRRQSSANRVLTILKAALNLARDEGRYTGPDDEWRGVKSFRGADAPRVRYLSDAEAVRLVNACPQDFRDLVTAALLTGARYGELIAMKAGDLDGQAGTVNIPRSKSGKGRHVVLTDEGRAFFKRMAMGKPGGDVLFRRNAVVQQATRNSPAVIRRAAWNTSDQFRAMAAACVAANITPAVSFHVLRHTYATRLASKAAPMMVIAAQLGHADTRMTERHYAHAAPSYVADTVRAAFGSLGLEAEHSNGSVVGINERKRGSIA